MICTTKTKDFMIRSICCFAAGTAAGAAAAAGRRRQANIPAREPAREAGTEKMGAPRIMGMGAP